MSPPPFSSHQLVLHKLGCERGGRELFRSISSELDSGELLAVTGANGAGKTSLLRILVGLALPAAGAVLWNGLSILKQPHPFREQLAYIGHLPGTKRYETPTQHLCHRLALAGERVDVAAIQNALAAVGLERFAAWPCGELSVGQNRRVALAYLLARPVPLWVLDEPLAGLDVQGQELVAEMLQQQVNAGGMVALTTHQPLDIAGVQQRELHVGAV